MKEEKIFDAIANIDEKYIVEARLKNEKKSQPLWMKWGAIAVCFCLVFIGVQVFINRKADRPAQRPISAYMQADVSGATVYHTVQGKTIESVVEEHQDLYNLRIWTNNLEYILFNCNGATKPTDLENTEVYKIVFKDGDYPGFSYIISENHNYYLLIEEHWYSVINPSNPPIVD